MPDNVIGKIPEFTSDSEAVEPQDLTTAASESDAIPQGAEPEKETPSIPPVEETPDMAVETQPVVNTDDLKEQKLREIAGLEETRRELLHELTDLRGQKREAKQEQIAQVQEKIDQLEDINPDDVSLIDRVLKAKGYVAKQDVNKMFYEARKQEVFSKFFKEFPEYSEANDPDRRKFGPLIRELQLYKEPSDPDIFGDLLRRAHQAVSRNQGSSDRSPSVLKRQAEIAGVGSGGAQRSSSIEGFSMEKRMALIQGGWSDEDIKNMEKRASLE